MSVQNLRINTNGSKFFTLMTQELQLKNKGNPPITLNIAMAMY